MSRVEWVDNARGIGICLIILAHTKLGSSLLGDYIDSFRTTLFFFVAGYLFSLHKYDHFPTLLRKKAATLIVPYFVFAAVSYPYFVFRYSFSSTDYFKDLSPTQQFFGIFYSAGTTEWMDFNLPLWYLTCLFVVYMMFYALNKYMKAPIPLALALILCSLIGYADGLWSPVRLPWGIDVAVSAVVFFGFGYMLKAVLDSLVTKSIFIRLALAALFFLPNLRFDDPLLNLNMKLQGSYFDFYIGAFSGIAFCILLSSMIRAKVLAFLGQHALLLTASHMPLLNMTRKLMEHVTWIPNLYVAEMIRAVLTVLLTLPFIYIFNKYPLLLGKGNKTAYAGQ